jgi:hypothetical protein
VRRLRFLLMLLAGAVLMLLARVARRSPREDAADVWSDVPSAPQWYADRRAPVEPSPAPAEPSPSPAESSPAPAAEPLAEAAPLPIEHYDELRAVDIAASVRALDDPDDVQRVLDYEEAHNQRVTVFRAAKARLRALEAAANEPLDA